MLPPSSSGKRHFTPSRVERSRDVVCCASRRIAAACHDRPSTTRSRNPCAERFWLRYSQARNRYGIAPHLHRAGESAQNRASTATRQERLSSACTSLAAPACEPPALDCSTSTYSRTFLIDSRIRKSKNTIVLRQLLKFSRLVRRPGLKRSHPLHRKMTEGGLARVYSKVLVEANKKIC